MSARPSGDDWLIFKLVPTETVPAHYGDQRLSAGHRDGPFLFEIHIKHTINTLFI